MISTRVYLVAACTLIALLAAACSSGDDSSKQLRIGSLSFNDHGTKDATGKASLEFEVDSYYFSPSFIKGSAGQKLTLTIGNDSGDTHNFSLPGTSVSQDIPAKGKAQIDITFPQSGVAQFLCKYHTGQGMNGQLLVGNATPQPASLALIATRPAQSI